MNDAGADKSGGKGDSFGSIEAVYLAYESELLRFARRIVDNDEDAQDVVQEAFMRLHNNFNTVKQPRAYLYRTVHNLALNKKTRDEKVIPLYVNPEDSDNRKDIEDFSSDIISPDEEIARIEAIEITREMVNKLNDRSRMLIHLKFNEGLSYKEISEKTGLTVSNVGFILHQALKELAAEFKKAGLLR